MFDIWKTLFIYHCLMQIRVFKSNQLSIITGVRVISFFLLFTCTCCTPQGARSFNNIIIKFHNSLLLQIRLEFGQQHFQHLIMSISRRYNQWGTLLPIFPNHLLQTWPLAKTEHRTKSWIPLTSFRSPFTCSLGNSDKRVYMGIAMPSLAA